MIQSSPLKENEYSDSGVFSEIEPFVSTLSQHDLILKRRGTKILQVNMGLLCNQVCRHCHLNAGPGRRETMGLETVQQVDFNKIEEALAERSD